LLALGRGAEARESLARARDLDALRFRADSRVNATIRGVAAMAGRGTSLLDAARRFEQGVAGHPPLPGRRLFYEHVHLTFEGNLALAGAVAEALESILPAAILQRANGRRPGASEVAERLAFTAFDRWSLERDVLDIVSRPPFVGQLDHGADVEQRRLGLGRLKKRLTAGAWQDAEAVYRRALARDAGDFEIRRRFALLLESRGRHREAAEHWRALLDRRPEIDAWRAALASDLASAGDGEAALAELDRLRASAGDSADLRVHRGTLLEILGRQTEADGEYARALELAPGHKLASFNLATSALRRGELARAEALLRALLARHDFAPGHHNLGRCLELQGRLDDAIAAYRRALAADAGHSPARNSLALALERRGEPDRAIAEYRLLLAYEPDDALAHFNLADLLLSLGRAAEAASHYRQGLALAPGNAQARTNLGLALETIAAGR
jgi:tetratricopeptide (TPR) repeat protein